MKTAVRIFGVIIIFIVLLAGAMSIFRAERDKEDVRENQIEIAKAQQELSSLKEEARHMTGESKAQMDEQIAAAESGMEKLPSESTYTFVQVLLGALVVLSLVFGVFMFRPNLKLSTILFAVSFVLLLASYFVSPDLKRGEYSGFPSRTLALLTGIPVVLTGLLALAAAKVSMAKR